MELGASFIVDPEMESVVVVNGTDIVVQGVFNPMSLSDSTVCTDMDSPSLLAWVAAAFAVG